MKTQEQIQQIADSLGAKIVFNKKSFGELHKHITDEESISGIMDGVSSLGVITNKRFILLTASIFSAPDLKEIGLSNIVDISTDLGMMASNLMVKSAASTLQIAHSKKDVLTSFKNTLSATIEKSKTPVTVVAQVDVVSQLERLADLKTKGILTEEEFAEQKKKILSQN